MEDFFQILIFLIVIISFLSSLLKKKEPPAPPGRTSSRYPDKSPEDTGYIPAKTSSEEYDILREIETLFKTGEQVSKPKTLEKPSMSQTPIEENKRSESETTSYESGRSESETTSYETGRSGSEHVPGDYVRQPSKQRELSELSSTSSEHVMGNWWENETKKAKDKSRQIDKKISDKAEEFEKLLSRKRREENIFNKNLINKFKHPSTLKEYIIISEILGKPKSLQ